MDAGEQTTGTRDEHYNLISVLYHALHGAETIEAYILDAEAAGDERLASFFREAQAMQRQLAERAKGMLGILEEAGPEAGVPPGTAPGRTTRKVPPDAAPQAPPRDVRRGTSPEDLPRTGDFPPSTSDPPPTDVPLDSPPQTPPPSGGRPLR